MLNQVQLIGFLGKDPESRTFDSGTRKATFSLATSEKRKNKKGEQTETTEWHTIVCWDALADIAQKYFRKGQQVYVQGKLQSRSWDATDGSKRYVTEIVAHQIFLLGKRESAQSQSNQNVPWD
jgi:single-strand DNA-binding protein